MGATDLALAASSPGVVRDTLVLSNGTLEAGATNPPVCLEPSAVTYDSYSHLAYVSCTNSNLVAVVNTTTYSVQRTIPVGSAQFEPMGIAYDSKNGNIYVAGAGSNNVTVLNGSTGRTVGSVVVTSYCVCAPPAPNAVLFDPVNGYIYVAIEDPYGNRGNVTVINGTDDSVLTTIQVNRFPKDLVFDAKTKDLYVANDANISVISTTSESVVGWINPPVGALAIAIDPLNNRLLSTCDCAPSVADVYNAKNLSYVSEVTLGSKGSIDGIPDSAIFDASTGDFYVFNCISDNTTLTVIKGSDSTVTGWIATGPYANGCGFPEVYVYGSAISLVGTHQYLWIPYLGSSGQQANNVTVVDLKAGTFLRNLALDGVGPLGLAIATTLDRLYVADEYSNSVTEINTSSNHVIANFAAGFGPNALAYDTSNGRLYVVDSNSQVEVLNGSTGSPVAVLDAGAGADAIAYDSATGAIYVSNLYSHNVSVIDGATDAIVRSITVGSDPDAIAYDSANQDLYVANEGENNVSIISGTTDAVIGSVAVGTEPSGVAVDPTLDYVFVSNRLSDNVTVVAGNNNTVLRSVSVGSDPRALAVDTSNGYVYVGNSGGLTVFVAKTGKVLSTISLGTTPAAVAIFGTAKRVYTANYYEGTVTIVST